MGSFLPQTQQLEAMFSAIFILRLIVGYDSKSSFVAQLDGRTCLYYMDNPMQPMGYVVWLYSNFNGAIPFPVLRGQTGGNNKISFSPVFQLGEVLALDYPGFVRTNEATAIVVF